MLALLALSTGVQAYQDPAAVKKAAEDFLRAQTKGMSGAVSYSVGHIDPANQLPPCSGFQVRQDGGRLWGRTTVTVQCIAGANWALFVPVQVKIMGNYLVARRNLGAGQTLSDADIEIRQGDITEFPGNLLDSPQLALGKTLGVSLIAGQPLRSDALRLPTVVQQGQRVTIVSRGSGFSVSSEGQALNNASEEAVVRVRLPNGQVVSGIAKAGGIVEITH
ncbi:flagellar basal body P-ring formation chaperone FlgA [Denitratisoma sp. agr-D3]